MSMSASPKVQVQASQAVPARVGEGTDARERQAEGISGAGHTLDDEQLGAVVAGVGSPESLLAGAETASVAGRRPIIW